MGALGPDVALVEIDDDHRGLGDRWPARPRFVQVAGTTKQARPIVAASAAHRVSAEASRSSTGKEPALRRLPRHALLGKDAHVDEAREALEGDCANRPIAAGSMAGSVSN